MKKYSVSGESGEARNKAPQEYIALDVHKHYSLMEREAHSTGKTWHTRIDHAPGVIHAALVNAAPRIKPGTAVAVEATGNWYWVIDEIEQAGLVPLLVNPGKAKMMMGQVNKTDKLDVHGLNRLQRNGVLPTVWIPPAELRDLREVTRVRGLMSAQRTVLKNRIHATCDKYAIRIDASDIFGVKGRRQLNEALLRLPSQTAWATQAQLDYLDFTVMQLKAQEKHIAELIRETPEMQLLKTLPGVGNLLAAVITLEIGEVDRFASAENLASYAGTTPHVSASGGKVRYGHVRKDVNNHLKWGFSEAANSVAVNHKRFPDRHVSQLYRRIRERKGHAKAVGAVSRHLAEASYYVLSRRQPYLERGVVAPAATATH